MKVADFGLSRNAKLLGESEQPRSSGGYYESVSSYVPLRWTAPEVLQTQRYTFQSDVWSFGITMIEVFLDGGEPRQGSDGRPAQPVSCPDPEFALLCQCFSKNPDVRPTFEALAEAVEASLKKLPPPRIVLDSEEYVDQHFVGEAVSWCHEAEYDQLPLPPRSDVGRWTDSSESKPGYYSLISDA